MKYCTPKTGKVNLIISPSIASEHSFIEKCEFLSIQDHKGKLSMSHTSILCSIDCKPYHIKIIQ